ncbi:MAG TPA: zinc-binding alcohol dehydrogenase [Longimicrobiales bacterium]
MSSAVERVGAGAAVVRCRVVEHVAPRVVRVVEEPLGAPGPGRVLVATRVSAISAGTELLVHRGEVPAGVALDESIEALRARFAWPVRYGYAAVGDVIGGGEGTRPELIGRRVFAFQPHRSHFVERAEAVVPLPETLDAGTAAMLPSMEAALGLVMDARPLPGERVLVAGQGVVGLLTTALLARIPLAALVVVDPIPARRRAALALGATAAVEPGDAEALVAGLTPGGADLAFELSGNPAALNEVVRATGREGRIIVGSWYGTRRAALDLGTRFHRARLTVRSSQVSRIDPALAGRWSKARRLAFAVELLRRLRPAGLITHRFPVARAAAAFRLLDQTPGDALQVLLTYDDEEEGCTGSA